MTRERNDPDGDADRYNDEPLHKPERDPDYDRDMRYDESLIERSKRIGGLGDGIKATQPKSFKDTMGELFQEYLNPRNKP